MLNINVIWGNSKLMLDYLPWSSFNYRLRGWNLLQGRPICFSVYSSNSIFIGPPPDQTYPVELDLIEQPYYFTGPTDVTVDTIPFPFQSPVSYYACYQAKQRMQQWQEAQWFHNMYKSQMMSANQSSFTRRLGRAVY
jgi:hypothetical protein